jgi:predicted RNA-binding protein
MKKTRYWIIVASEDHVKRGVAEGFAQACHGKASPLKRMQSGDYVLYYSGKKYFGKPDKCQMFTAVGQVKDDEVYQCQMSPDFFPSRRNIHFFPSKEASITALIDQLEFIKNKKRWGYPFRLGFLEISEQDFNLISSQMLNTEYA